MSRLPVLRMLPRVLWAMTFMTTTAAATGIVNARWEGQDFLVRFADSVGYTVDLAASDSSQVVLRIPNAELPRNAAGAGAALAGPVHREAVLSESGPHELRITVRGTGRLGYSSLWRPYSRTLVVHTFDWNQLEYGEEQYHKALLALEQGLEQHGLELLRIAYATGDPRAASVLGTYYARHGKYNVAIQYLPKPVTADDYAALAAVQLATGDSTAGMRNRQAAERILAGGDSSWAASHPADRRELRAQEGNAEATVLNGRDRWLFLGIGAVVLFLLILLVIWLSRRSSRRQMAEPDRGIDRDAVAPRPRPEDRRVDVAAAPPPAPPAAPRHDAVPEKEPGPAASAPATATPPPAAAPPEHPAREVTPVEQVHQSGQPHPAADAEPIDVESRPVMQKPAHVVSSQAADLRRRIESMHQQADLQSPPPAPGHPKTSEESTVEEARRLQLSRDSVDLRRRLRQDIGNG